MDGLLQQAADRALGDREGAIIAIDPQNGRIRALANARLAFEQAFPPGSTIKPFTALAALRQGLIDAELRVKCPGRYARSGFEITCSHPRVAAPLSLAQALAYSCNYYFASVGERLSEGPFAMMLASFGFGARTGVNGDGESAGRFIAAGYGADDALGETDHVLATPIQLLVAYVALVNGGRMYRPHLAAPGATPPQVMRRIQIAGAHRQSLIEGMKGAVRYGSARAARLDSLGISVFGKTGTSTTSSGFRTQGWFVGFAAGPSPDLPPSDVKLGVLVFLKRGHGSEAAEVARALFEEFTKAEEPQPAIAEAGLEVGPTSIKVHLVREQRTRSIGLEDYIAGVLAAEASVESEPEALKAQAVASRTFALKNLQRHEGDGYDFCSTTHCQRYTEPSETGGENAITAAVTATRGEVLKDERGRLLDSYFSASCGGMTANVESLWGLAGPSHLRSVRDEFCASMPHRTWIETIPASRLARALESDPRTDVGGRLDDVVVVKRDETGRAQSIALEGDRRRVIGGWEFKLVVGRSMGWNVLKSSRFDVWRSGSSLVFRGSGFGHGLGLCQEGAHVMAARGNSHRRILSHYFPGAKVERFDKSAGESSAQADRVSSGRRGLSSEHFRVSYPAETPQRDVESALVVLEAAHRDITRRLAAASLRLVAEGRVEVTVHKTTQDFIASTGQPWWTAAVTRGSSIALQPIAVLKRRRVLETTLRHEYTHIAIESLSGRPPRWLVEGLAAHVAGEGPMLSRRRARKALAVAEIEVGLSRPASPEEMRLLYAEAYRNVLFILRTEGEAALWRLAARQVSP